MTEQIQLKLVEQIVESFLTNELRQINQLRIEEGAAEPQVDQDLRLIGLYLETRLSRLRECGIEPMPEPNK